MGRISAVTYILPPTHDQDDDRTLATRYLIRHGHTDLLPILGLDHLLPAPPPEPKEPPVVEPRIPPCGTYAAYQRHKKLRDQIDDACRRANTEYKRRYRRTRPDAKERDRIYSIARWRALERLRRAHMHEFHRYFTDETARIKAEERGKAT